MAGFRFTNTTDKIDYGNLSMFNSITAVSIAFRFKYDGDGAIFSKWESGLTFITNTTDSGKLAFATRALNNALQVCDSTNVVFVAGNTYYVVVTWVTGAGTGQDQIRLYVDDVSVARTYAVDADQNNNGLNNSTDKVQSGSSASASNSGDMDLFYTAAWDVVLSAGSITSLAGGAAPDTIEASDLIWYDPYSTDPPEEEVGSFAGTVTGATFITGGASTIPIIMHHLRQQGIS